jgi:hypothetical protein
MKRGKERQLHIRSIRDAGISVITKIGERWLYKTSRAAPSRRVLKAFRSFILPRFKKRPNRLIVSNTRQLNTELPGVLHHHIVWIFGVVQDKKYFLLRVVRTRSLRPYALSAESGSRAF